VREIIFLGRGPTRVDCPYDKEVWTVSYSWEFTKHIFDKVFTVHALKEEDNAYLKKLSQAGCEIIATETSPDYPVTIYPFERILKRFGVKLFSDLVCYMMAYAIEVEKVDKIWWYGIDCLGYATYAMERGGMEFWAGVARGAGIEVINTHDSANLKPKNGMYGDWGDRKAAVAELFKKHKNVVEYTQVRNDIFTMTNNGQADMVDTSKFPDPVLRS